jgi:hypothetical protein
LLTSSSTIAGLAVLLAVLALWRARTAVQRIERMTESYWELRYENGQLKSRVARLEVQAGLREAPPEQPQDPPPARPSFIPLSSLRK